MKAAKGWTVLGVDGNHITIAKSPGEGKNPEFQLVISIRQNDEGGRVATVRVDKDQFEALLEDKYDFFRE